MLLFKSIDELKPYYNKDIKTYEFDDSVDFRFNLDVNAHIKALNIKALNIKARDIIAWNIKAWVIEARNIISWDIKAGEIDAGDIHADNIIADKINAKDITYFAVCYAHDRFTCTSIKGRRKNHKHFVLDGKITIKGETE